MLTKEQYAHLVLLHGEEWMEAKIPRALAAFWRQMGKEGRYEKASD